MPTGLPARSHQSFDFAVLHLIMVPASVLFFSTLLQGDAISATTLLRTLLRAADAIAEAELGFGRGWILGQV
jgi:hypothetical protein